MRRGTFTFELNWGTIGTIAILAVVGFILWSIAPLGVIHGLARLFWLHPIGWALIIIAGVLFFGVVQVDSEHGNGVTRTTIVGILAVLGLIFYAFLSGAITNTYIIRDLEPAQLDALPETTEIRYLPMPVAERYGANKIQDPTHSLGDMDPLDTGTGTSWVAPRVPTGIWNSLTGQTDGFMIVNSDGSVDTIHQTMRYGEGMIITDNITWPLWKIHYTVDLPEFYYLRIDEEVLTIAPYIAYRFEFPVNVPYWGGVFVVHPDGQIEDLTPQAAVEDPRFEGQRLFPEELARRIGEAWAFRSGITNAWFTHVDQTEVPNISYEANQMPYLLPTAEGPKWFIGMEPYGPAYSIFKVLFVDAHDGSLQLYELPAESGMISPNQAGNYVKAAFPTYKWGDESGNLVAIEPRPLIKAGVLYWQMSITTNSHAGVTGTALVNAKNTDVIYFKDESELQRFMAGTFSGHQTEGTVTQNDGTTPTNPTGDLGEMSESELWDLLRQVIAELESR